MQQETKLKPFDLQKALAGEPVVTRDGRRVLEIYHFKTDPSKFCVGVIIEGSGFFSYCVDGTPMRPYIPSSHDLYMVPVKREVWVNLYRGVSGNWYTGSKNFKSSEEALEKRAPVEDYVRSVKIHEYEE